MPTAKLLMALPLAALFAAATLHAPAHAQDGMVVVRNPETGELRPATQAEFKALTSGSTAAMRANAPAAQLSTQVERFPDGRRKVTLGQRGQVFEVVKRSPDGKLTKECVQGEDAAARALSQPATHQQEPRHEDR